MRAALRLIAAAMVALSSLGPAAAQDDIRSEAVHFAPGATATTIRGSIVGRASAAYRLGAEAGQRMTVSLAPSNGATYFTVFGPGQAPGGGGLAGSDVTGPMVPDLNRFDATLSASGEYTILVYLYRSAARRGERSDYVLDISITGETGETVGGDFADGLAGGPDFFEVRTARGGALNLRSEPSRGASVVTQLVDGATLRNLGCRMAEGRRWCRVATLADSGIEGWAAGEFLIEGGGEGAPQAAPAPMDAAMPRSAEKACLAAVSRVTGAGEVALLGSEPGAAGLSVRVGVGPDRAPWRCVAYADGSTGGIMYLSEDALVPGTPFNAMGETECYATSGSGAQTCSFGAARAGNGGGSVTVTLPDGASRVILYDGGAPTGFVKSEADGDLSFESSRQDDGYMIFIGDQGVFLPDAVIFGG